MKENILNDQILNTVNKWGAIYLDDLVSHLSSLDFKTDLSRLYINRLTKKGLLEKISDAKDTRKRILLPKSVKDFYTSEDDVTQNCTFHAHDSITSGICLDITKFDSVADVNGSRHSHDPLSKKGDLIPDAELVIWNDKKTGLSFAAIEVEIQQKNKVKITNKLLAYSTNTNYSHVLYFFPSQRMAFTYHLVLKKLEHDHSENKTRDFGKFVFLFRKDETLKLTKFDTYQPLLPESQNTIKSIFRH
jgi:hypothetical protein